jgi:hypothetical protein
MTNKLKFETQYIDIASISETFADSLGPIFMDGETMRIELCVTRLDEPKPPKSLSGKKYPVCRLALTLSAATDLYNQLTNIVAALKRNPATQQKPSSSPTATH